VIGMLLTCDLLLMFGAFTSDGHNAPTIGHVEGISSTTLVCPFGKFAKHTPICCCTIADTPPNSLMDSIASPIGENSGRIRSWGMLLN
jgi:hypothetical protein